MATALPVLERENTNERSESSLKAYGKLSGGAEPASMTEEQKALKFNARISENYQKLINPDLKKAEDIMGASAPVGINVAVFAQIHGKDYPQSVKSIVLSTVFSIATMPAVIGLAGYLWGY